MRPSRHFPPPPSPCQWPAPPPVPIRQVPLHCRMQTTTRQHPEDSLDGIDPNSGSQAGARKVLWGKDDRVARPAPRPLAGVHLSQGPQSQRLETSFRTIKTTLTRHQRRTNGHYYYYLFVIHSEVSFVFIILVSRPKSRKVPKSTKREKNILKLP